MKDYFKGIKDKSRICVNLIPRNKYVSSIYKQHINKYINKHIYIYI